jgi:hypothetical protein
MMSLVRHITHVFIYFCYMNMPIIAERCSSAVLSFLLNLDDWRLCFAFQGWRASDLFVVECIMFRGYSDEEISKLSTVLLKPPHGLAITEEHQDEQHQVITNTELCNCEDASRKLQTSTTIPVLNTSVTAVWDGCTHLDCFLIQ